MALTKIDDRGLKTPIDLLDNEEIRFGTGNDLKIWHNGNHSYIQDAGTGNLYIDSIDGNIYIRPNQSETGISVIENGAVILAYDNSPKLETTSTGIYVDSTIRAGTTTGTVSGGNALIMSGAAGSRVKLCRDDSGVGNSDGFELVMGADDTTYLWNRENTNLLIGTNGTERLRITSSGNVNIANDSGKLQLGTSQDLKLYHDGNDSYISDTGTGDLYLSSNKLKVNNGANDETLAIFNENGAVELNYDNSKKFETTSSGITMSGSISFSDNTSNIDLNDQNKLRVGSSADLQISHQSSDSLIEETNHHLTVKVSTADKNLYLQSDDQIKIGTSTGEEQHIVATKNGAVELYYDNSKKLDTSSTGINVTGDIHPSGHIYMDSGYGVAFDPYGSSGVNLLDDYEEGDFDVYIGGQTNKDTYNSNGNGQYTKIGRMVHVHGYFAGINIDDSASGQAMIYGLPFTPTFRSYGGAATASVHVSNVNFDPGKKQCWSISSLGFYGYESTDNGAHTSWDISNFTNTSTFVWFSATYITAT